ncbi:septum formation initiator family protein [Candidatus Saccharibacteria bacterium]|nr:septum formation initiator family protein [Candidatus Saccharibacteria bacterium]
MQKFANLLRKIRRTAKYDIFTLHNVVDVGAVIVCVFFAWGLISSISRNWELEQKLRERQLSTLKAEIEVDRLRLEQEYYKTDEYKELVARQKLGKMLPGETMVVLPKNTDAALSKYAVASDTTSDQSNFSQWLKLLFK